MTASLHRLLLSGLALSAWAGASPLNITALSSRGGISLMECWQLAAVPVEARSAINYDVGDMAEATWSVIQPRTTVGEAWAPSVQLSMVLNGLVRITSPAAAPASTNGSMLSPTPGGGFGNGGDANGSIKSTTMHMVPGTLASSLVIAADLKSVSTVRGHFTEFPGDEPTVLVQIPFAGDRVPAHRVLHDGPCRPVEG